MTWGNPPPFKSDPPKPGKIVTPEQLAGDSESSHQQALFCWSALSVGKYPQLKWLHAIPNGGLRDIRAAVKLKAEGVKSGVWDIFLPCPVHPEWDVQYAGLYIEMKEPKRRKQKYGGLSEEQLEFGAYAKEMGYYVAICYTWEEARDIIINYLEGRL